MSHDSCYRLEAQEEEGRGPGKKVRGVPQDDLWFNWALIGRRAISQVLAASITPKKVRQCHKRKVVSLPSIVLNRVYVKQFKKNIGGVVGMVLSQGSTGGLSIVSFSGSTWRSSTLQKETSCGKRQWFSIPPKKYHRHWCLLTRSRSDTGVLYLDLRYTLPETNSKGTWK